jgi:transcriptional regulator with GAF, ATPase, and Fis domain
VSPPQKPNPAGPGLLGRLDATERLDDGLAPASVMRRAPRLVWTDARGAHGVVIETRTVLGAAPEANVVLTDPAVSRLHAELDLQESGLWVRDLGSRNGTYLEGLRVGHACVPEGGRLRFGNTELVVEVPTEPKAVELWPSGRFGPLVGPSAQMRELFARLGRVARTDATVLIHGETGTGKELIARALHDASPRAGGPFVVVDCGALPESLLEAELFGHTRGAFTGATEARVGSIEAASGGTLFLDEIGELPLAMQPKLLRALESRTVRRIGETAHRPVDVRFVAATHRDLGVMVNARGFREDLYFRLAVVPLTVPPLRERPQDVVALVQHFVPEGARARVTPEVLRELLGRPWYGNVRELRNFVERALVLGASEALALERAARAGGSGVGAGDAVQLPAALVELPYKEARERAINAIERAYLAALLDRHGRNISASAEAAGLNRTYLHHLVKKHEL